MHSPPLARELNPFSPPPPPKVLVYILEAHFVERDATTGKIVEGWPIGYGPELEFPQHHSLGTMNDDDDDDHGIDTLPGRTIPVYSVSDTGSWPPLAVCGVRLYSGPRAHGGRAALALPGRDRGAARVPRLVAGQRPGEDLRPLVSSRHPPVSGDPLRPLQSLRPLPIIHDSPDSWPGNDLEKTYGLWSVGRENR
jgi:hypothetical protein